MRLFQSRSIKARLMLISLLTMATALLVSGIVLGEKELTDYKRSLVNEMTVQASIIGSNCAADLLFSDPKAAEDTLKALRASPHVETAVIYSKDREVFAAYRRGDAAIAVFASLPLEREGYRFDQGHLAVYQNIIFKGNKIGSLYIRADLEGFYERMKWYYATLLGVILVSGLLGLAIFSRLQRSITAPILGLVGLMKDISSGKGYSVRAKTERQDELGLLSEGFNEMLAQIQIRDDELARQQRHLEDLVAKRTETLESTKSQLEEELSERACAEERLRQSEEFVRNILDSVDEGFIVIDRDYRILTANKAYCRLVGKAIEDVIGIPCFAVSHKIARPCHEKGEECAVKTVFETGRSHTAVQIYQDGEGNMTYVETKAFPLKESGGTVTLVIETITDITERRLLEEEQLKSQKLEAIGTLAGGIAHDFNNLLQGVFGYISLAKLRLGGKDEALLLQQAEQALTMATNLTGQLLTFSKGGKPLKRRIGLRSVIESSARLALSGSPLDCEYVVDEALWHVDADEGQIGQVIQNFVLNAKQAMPRGGCIRISAHNALIPAGKHTSFPFGGKFIKIAVEDTGAGIHRQHLPKIFDPYFTTKQTGSGLGLATAYSIIKNHGGAIEVISEQEKGSTFFVYLPATEWTEERPERSPSFAGRRKGKILIMDDEEMVRNVACDMISALGHEVECAAEGYEAISKFIQAKDSASPFDIVILDLTVKGGLGGEQTITSLRGIDPTVKAVVSSGYGDSPVVADYRSYGFSACLNKPYLVTQMKDLLNSLLV